MIEGDKVARQAASFVLRFVLDDDNWRLLGYRRRPRRGKFFLRFISVRRLERETKVLHEMLCLALAGINWWVRRRQLKATDAEALLGRVFEICLDGFDQALWTTFRFPSREDAILYVRTATIEYASAGYPREMPPIFYRRILPLLAETEKARWLAYSVNLCMGPNSFLSSVCFAMDRVVGDDPIAPRHPDDQLYLRIVKDILESGPRQG